MTRIGLAAWLWLGVSCAEPGQYDVEVVVPGELSRLERVEVYVVGSCDDIDTNGDAPAAPLLTLVVSGGSGPLGHVASGRYALYGRAWSDECELFAAGCTDFEVEEGESGSIRLVLAEIPPRSCDGACSDGTCSDD